MCTIWLIFIFLPHLAFIHGSDIYAKIISVDFDHAVLFGSVVQLILIGNQIANIFVNFDRSFLLPVAPTRLSLTHLKIASGHRHSFSSRRTIHRCCSLSRIVLSLGSERSFDLGCSSMSGYARCRGCVCRTAQGREPHPADRLL